MASVVKKRPELKQANGPRPNREGNDLTAGTKVPLGMAGKVEKNDLEYGEDLCFRNSVMI